MLLQHTREGKDTRWHQHIQTDFIKLLRYLYLFRYLHECYQYLVKKKRHLTGRSMTDNWAKVDSFIFIFWFPPKRWSCVCHFDRGFYQPSIGRGKSWADGCARETKERRRLICSTIIFETDLLKNFFSAKTFLPDNNIDLLLDDLQQIILIAKDALLHCIRPAQKQRRLNIRFLKYQIKVCFEKSTSMI